MYVYKIRKLSIIEPCVYNMFYSLYYKLHYILKLIHFTVTQFSTLLWDPFIMLNSNLFCFITEKVIYYTIYEKSVIYFLQLFILF